MTNEIKTALTKMQEYEKKLLSIYGHWTYSHDACVIKPGHKGHSQKLSNRFWAVCRNAGLNDQQIGQILIDHYKIFD